MSDSNVRLIPHTDVDTETVRVLMNRLDKSLVVSGFQRIAEGGSTSNYAVCFTDGRRLLLKIYPENGGNGALEMAAYQYAGQCAKVPEVLLFDDSLAVFHRPYAIIEFIDGVGLNQYISRTGGLPGPMARTIGERLARLHGRQYRRMALLDTSLNERQVLLPVSGLHAYYLNGAPGKQISPDVREDVLGYLQDHPQLLDALAETVVFNHGDLSPANILVDVGGEIWFIDFEYSLAASPYYDIGKFFRDRPGISDLFGQQMVDSFIQGYQSCAVRRLRNDWYPLSRLMDMTSLLHLLNYESAACWSQEIEEMIRHTMRILKGGL